MSNSVIVKLESEPGKSTWLAYIEGPDRKYGLARDFLCAIERPAKGQAGTHQYLILEPGYYEGCEKDGRLFFRLRKGKIEPVEREVVWGWAAKTRAFGRRVKKRAAKETQRLEAEVDDRIARFNSEGGFEISEN